LGAYGGRKGSNRAEMREEGQGEVLFWGNMEVRLLRKEARSGSLEGTEDNRRRAKMEKVAETLG